VRPDPPPRQFVGQARALRAAIAAEDTAATATIERLIRPLYTRAQRHPVPRPGELAGVARAWREVIPAGGRLALYVAVRRKTLELDELRVSTVDFRFRSWSTADFEPGLAIIHVRLRIAPKTGFELESPIIACASIHALARRFQRGFDTSRAAILADVAALASLPAGDTWELAVPEGRWIGVTVALTHGDRTADTPVARTFL
jgi:hypothetical protein